MYPDKRVVQQRAAKIADKLIRESAVDFMLRDLYQGLLDVSDSCGDQGLMELKGLAQAHAWFKPGPFLASPAATPAADGDGDPSVSASPVPSSSTLGTFVCAGMDEFTGGINCGHEQLRRFLEEAMAYMRAETDEARRAALLDSGLGLVVAQRVARCEDFQWSRMAAYADLRLPAREVRIDCGGLTEVHAGGIWFYFGESRFRNLDKATAQLALHLHLAEWAARQVVLNKDVTIIYKVGFVFLPRTASSVKYEAAAFSDALSSTRGIVPL